MPAGALFVSPMLVSIEQCSYGSLKVGNASVACEGGRSLRPGALDASGRHEERELSTTADDDASPATLYELAPARLCIRRCDAGMCKRVDNSGGGTTYNLKPARRISEGTLQSCRGKTCIQSRIHATLHIASEALLLRLNGGRIPLRTPPVRDDETRALPVMGVRGLE